MQKTAKEKKEGHLAFAFLMEYPRLITCIFFYNIESTNSSKRQEKEEAEEVEEEEDKKKRDG